jgi:hypothetical protein
MMTRIEHDLAANPKPVDTGPQRKQAVHSAVRSLALRACKKRVWQRPCLRLPLNVLRWSFTFILWEQVTHHPSESHGSVGAKT